MRARQLTHVHGRKVLVSWWCATSNTLSRTSVLKMLVPMPSCLAVSRPMRAWSPVIILTNKPCKAHTGCTTVALQNSWRTVQCCVTLQKPGTGSIGLNCRILGDAIAASASKRVQGYLQHRLCKQLIHIDLQQVRQVTSARVDAFSPMHSF